MSYKSHVTLKKKKAQIRARCMLHLKFGTKDWLEHLVRSTAVHHEVERRYRRNDSNERNRSLSPGRTRDGPFKFVIWVRRTGRCGGARLCAAVALRGIRRRKSMMPSRRAVVDDHLILPVRPPSAKRCPVCKAFGSERMQHASQCPLEPVYCENKCGAKVSRRLLQEHRANDCAKRLVPCPYCRKEFVFDTLKNHIPKCPRYLVQCHQCETAKIPREDLEHHLKDHCPAAAVGCVFKDLGCKFKGSQFALDQHLDESSKNHLSLLCGLVSRQQQQISALRSALHGLAANTTGTLLWKISDYGNKMADAKAQDGGLEICSPPFSTSPYGYRLMATLFLNGNGSGESSHLSVYIKLLPGEYDSLLPWPFSHTVSFTLLDQPSVPEKACNIVESFVPDPTWKNFQRPSREPDTLGFGFPRFVSHEMLKKCHYVRDNTLFIKVTVDESKIIAV